jgi:hypothetical protein
MFWSTRKQTRKDWANAMRKRARVLRRRVVKWDVLIEWIDKRANKTSKDTTRASCQLISRMYGDMWWFIKGIKTEKKERVSRSKSRKREWISIT